jgi:hypothetical protein
MSGGKEPQEHPGRGPVKPRLLTPEIQARIDDVAQKRACIPRFKKLAQETGLSVGYLRQLISARVRVLAQTNKCDDSRETENA